LTPPFFLAIIVEGVNQIMSIKLVVLKTGENLIADTKEAVKNEGDNPEFYVLNEPCMISMVEPYFVDDKMQVEKSSVKIQMGPWNVFSEDRSIVIFPDSILTIVTPIESVLKMYEEKVNGQNS
jgi:hypothetical protein